MQYDALNIIFSHIDWHIYIAENKILKVTTNCLLDEGENLIELLEFLELSV